MISHISLDRSLIYHASLEIIVPDWCILERLYQMRDNMNTKMRLSRTFKFDAAHKLVDYPGVCRRIHGHTYTLTVTVEGEPDDTGMIIDFFDMKKVVEETVIAKVDHTYLNDLYDQPTAENVAQDMFQALKKAFELYNVRLYSVKLHEGDKSCVEVFL